MKRQWIGRLNSNLLMIKWLDIIIKRFRGRGKGFKKERERGFKKGRKEKGNK